MTPLISVVMPAYNSEKYITDAIESVVQQTYTNWELIVIDDGSSDDTVRRIEKQAAKDLRIRFYKNEKNIGVSETRNRAISLANGEWVAFLDSDDIWDKHKLSSQLAVVAERKNVSLIYTGYSFINSYGEKNVYNFCVPLTITLNKLLYQNIISTSGVMIKRDLLIELPMGNDGLHEDYIEWIKLLQKGYRAYGINEPLHCVRIGVDTSRSHNKFKSIIKTYKTYRICQISSFLSMYYLLFNIIKNLYKYYRIYRGFVHDINVA